MLYDLHHNHLPHELRPMARGNSCRGLAGNSDVGVAVLRDCMRLGKGGQMFGACHSGGGGGRGQGGAMQVWLQLGRPWASHGGHAAQRVALQRCPALQQEGEEVVPGQREAVPGVSLSWGKPCRAETTTQEESAGEGLEGLTGTSAYPLHALQHQGLSRPHPLLLQTPLARPSPSTLCA